MNSMTTFLEVLNLEKEIDPHYEDKISRFEKKKQRNVTKSDIDLTIFKEGLCDLGLTYDKINHAFLSLFIPNKNLFSIGVYC